MPSEAERFALFVKTLYEADWAIRYVVRVVHMMEPIWSPSSRPPQEQQRSKMKPPKIYNGQPIPLEIATAAAWHR